MTPKSMNDVAVVVPNWNGKDSLGACLDSLFAQTLKPTVIVVENGSIDGSLEFLRDEYPHAELVVNKVNRGFAGGVNDGIRRAMDLGCEYVALFNNDAIAETNWLEQLVTTLQVQKEYGIATGKLVTIDKSHMDSTGDLYTVWGLPYPRGRGEPLNNHYDTHVEVFGASGGASLYRVKMLEEIGLFDEDFFAYYEDVDISFRAQLAAWKVRYVPKAVAYHQIGATSGKIRGFTTHQTVKNLPMLLIKNVPRRFLWRVAWRFWLANILFVGRAILRGQGWAAISGSLTALRLLPKKLRQRWHIQHTRKVSDEYIWAIMYHDLPPNAHNLRKLRAIFRRKRA